MAKIRPDHPLVEWLRLNKLSLKKFSERSKVSYSTLCRITTCRYDPSIEIAENIEEETFGKVTAKNLLNWHIDYRRISKS